MKALKASQYWTIGATVAFGFAQIWAAYHLSARLTSYGPAEDGGRWLLLGAAFLMVTAEMYAVVGASQKRW